MWTWLSRKLFKVKSYNFVLEGGSIDTNSEVLLTTSRCLLEKNRNYPLSKKEIEKFLIKTLKVKKVIWLNHGFLEGDDTDSHIDTLARFVNDNTIVYQTAYKDDPNYQELKKMEQELKKLKVKKVLDIGCGSGGFMLKAQKEGIDIVGIDISSKMIENAKKKNLDVYHIDLCEFSGEFDACVAIFDVINYMDKEYLSKFFSCVKRVLKKDLMLIQ